MRIERVKMPVGATCGYWMLDGKITWVVDHDRLAPPSGVTVWLDGMCLDQAALTRREMVPVLFDDHQGLVQWYPNNLARPYMPQDLRETWGSVLLRTH